MDSRHEQSDKGWIREIGEGSYRACQLGDLGPQGVQVSLGHGASLAIRGRGCLQGGEGRGARAQ